ncbi:hypothetical protein HMJ29_08025 [Hymenobacter taeanensis]|uniref:Glycosyltransferase RgtA/B/C/D-like domain-containing protein n=1 Tax=Hymenobacter taeanensis TaxID=2735321 RepID=A0A6M6BHX3_9BACT|nr:MULTISPECIES: hypothetical protein [Hymenobacter]QJX46883.1 hypothetical protein HMJ29_08025 [Hymenobacter taeanensis]UOQ80755.1 hypothetical protein MUN83_18370 [Hymenobacter sp. 5414T-23]
MLRTIPRFVWPVAVLLVGIRLLLNLHLNPGLEMNYDERRNARIADNYLEGRGYVSRDPERKQVRPDSFHASFPVFVYIGWSKAGLPRHYLTFLVYLAAAGCYLLGALYVQRTLGHFGAGQGLSWLGAGLWALSPGVVYYVGGFWWFENLALPLLIVVVYKLLRLYAGRPLQWPNALLIVAAVVLSCLLRGYLLAVYAILFAVFLVLIMRRQEYHARRMAWGLSLGLLLALVVAHVPTLLKNHHQFGAWTLSNQAGFELLQGHNSVTQGRFMFDWDDRKGPFDQYVRANVPQLDSLDQYEESRARARLARQWVAEHPAEEVQLWWRKTVLFFSPENFIADAIRTPWSPFTAVVHLAFFVALGLTLFHYKGLRFESRDALLLTPLVAVWLLSLVFFVGFRWRFFAEPALLLFPLVTWVRLRFALGAKKSQ